MSWRDFSRIGIDSGDLETDPHDVENVPNGLDNFPDWVYYVRTERILYRALSEPGAVATGFFLVFGFCV